MSNFSFLSPLKEYALFAPSCIEAERVFTSSTAMCAVGCRKALELAVKWIYAADKDITPPYQDNLQSLIHEPTFRYSIESQTWDKLRIIVKLGNLGVHTEKTIAKGEAVLALKGLFEFIQWIDYCYGNDYEERFFQEALIPHESVTLDTQKIKAQASLLIQRESELDALRAHITELREQFSREKTIHQETRSFVPVDLTEYQTRKLYIDVDLKALDWVFGESVLEEHEVNDMLDIEGQKGFIDYLLLGRDGLPLALIEAKRTTKDLNTGKKQALLYADALERKYNRRPMIFLTNGFETTFWDDTLYPPRSVSGIFSQGDLQKLMNRRTEMKPLCDIPINDAITDRYYQKEAIRAVCDHITTCHRKSLLVMATGTGKTRTASSLTDVLSRGGYITNVLFLADRTALVSQAKDDFRQHLPDMTLCNLTSNKDDKNARIVFSTYPTILNAIDTMKNKEGKVLFTPAHFDLIIVDEAHRSIFKKYRTIFTYFDALVVGLTATPKTEVDRNTYDFFEMESGIPTYAYDYETAVNTDHVLVPYHNIETTLKFLDEGIAYNELCEEDKSQYEEDFEEENGKIPDHVDAGKMNQFVFNKQTVDIVIQDLMTQGIKVAGGDRIGKTIIFAQTKAHAQFIVERFDLLYPHLKGRFASRVVCDDRYAQSIIADFKQVEKEPHIVISVDMMDTGIDVPELVNLVYFKKVRSKTKFWQMLGRGTRLCKGLSCVDTHDGAYVDKRRFYIFDYLQNFEFFRQHKEGIEGCETQTLSEMIFAKQIRLIHHFQQSGYAEERYITWRGQLINRVVTQINRLNDQLVAVKAQRKHTEVFKHQEAYGSLTEEGKGNLIQYLAPLVFSDDTDGGQKKPDEYAKRFDNFIYGLILAQIEGSETFSHGKSKCIKIMRELEKNGAPQIREKLSLIQRVMMDDFWCEVSPLSLELIRLELRDLIQLLDVETTSPIYTALNDCITRVSEGNTLDVAYDFEDYKHKVNRYVEEHMDQPAIWKLRNNQPLTEAEYVTLSDILTKELGSEQDYVRTFQEKPLGLLIREIAKLDRGAAMAVFSRFINEQSLNQQQIVFVNKIIDYVAENGYLDNPIKLLQMPFDRPQRFDRLFNKNERSMIIDLLNTIKKNAVDRSA